jgi:alpha-glucosidase
MIGDQPGDLIESNIILNLNDPCKISDTSWIKPGKVVFPWWPDFKTESPVIGNEMTFDNQKYYLDFATEYEIPYLELEPPWYGDERECIKNPEKFDITTPTRSLQLPDLLEYGKERGVHFFIWAVWKNIEQQMNTALPLYEQWGAAGMKIDFMNRDDQDMVNFYHRVLQKAAEHHLMVYFHGAYKPTGIRRTWPNLLTREAVMGLEYNKWTDRITPEHNVTLPFTRMLAGPMDYTPGAFVNVTKDQFKPEYSEPMAMGTRCHQLAMYIVYESPLQMVADCPGNYRGEKSAEFLKIVPTTWDETRVLVGKIGDYIAVARRSGMDWYIGAMTDWTPRELDLSLDFLGENTFYATIYADGNAADENPELVTITKIKLHSKDHLITKLAPGGGVAVHMTPVIKNNPSLNRIK